MTVNIYYFHLKFLSFLSKRSTNFEAKHIQTLYDYDIESVVLCASSISVIQLLVVVQKWDPCEQLGPGRLTLTWAISW